MIAPYLPDIARPGSAELGFARLSSYQPCGIHMLTD